MKKLIYFIFLFFALIPSCLNATATISGTITDVTTGLPISGALIEAIRGDVVRYSATTGLDGTYSIAGIEPSNYTLVVSAPGYQSQSVGVKASNNQNTVVNFQLVPNGGTISGTVIDATSLAAISGATIDIFQGANLIATTTTNISGEYSIENLAPGNYIVLARAATYQTDAKGASVQAGVTTVVNFSLTANPGSITGSVKDSTTLSPISGALVEVFLNSIKVGFADTDALGNYAINGLAPGNYVVIASAVGFITQTQGASVVSNVPTTVNFLLESPPGSIEGTVSNAITHSPIANANVLVVQNFTVIASTLTDSNGNYSVSGLAQGNYSVIADAPNFMAAGLGASVTLGNTTIVNFTLFPNPGKIAGKVTDSSNMSPIAGATVQVFDNVILIATAITDSNGNYQVNDLDSGDYTVVATKNNYQIQSVGASVTSNNTTIVNFVLDPNPGSIFGTVTDASTNLPISNALVAVFKDRTFITYALTDANGNYEISNLAPANYFVVAFAKGYQTAFSIGSVTAGNETLANFSLNKIFGTISGVITDACSGRPVGGALVLVTEGEVIVGFVLSDSNGAYSVTGLAAGNYAVSVIKRNFLVNSRNATVSTNATTTLNFSLIPSALPAPPASISGTIICNRYLTQTDYIHTISWGASPSACITGYCILRNGKQIAFVPSSSQLKFVDCRNHRKKVQYSVKALNAFGKISEPVSFVFN